MNSFTLNYDSTINNLEDELSTMIDSGSEFDLEKNGDVLTLSFDDGSKIIISPNSPVSQLWVSANYEGHRFNYDEAKSTWIDEKTAEEFRVYIMRLIGGKLGL